MTRTSELLEELKNMRSSAPGARGIATDIAKPADKIGVESSQGDFSEFVDRRRPENEAERQAVHAAGLDRRKTYIGPERRDPKNKALRDAMDKRFNDLAECGETPVIDSYGRNVYADSAMKTSRKTGEVYPHLGEENGILID